MRKAGLLIDNWFRTGVEMALVIVLAAALGLVWNRGLLVEAWRGVPVPQTAPAQQGEALPMPIGLTQVKELVDAGQAALVDARSADSFAKEHIAGAISLPVEEARGKAGAPLLGQVATDAVVIVYCNGFSCPDSMELAKVLTKGGYLSVYVFEGGLPEWRDAGYPVAGGAR